MNQLTKYLISELLDGKTVTAVYGGGFKPPTKGHFDLVKKALDDNKEIDKFIIYVGGGVRDGITQEQSMQIWQLYKEILGNKVEIVPSKNPIGDVLRYSKNNPEEKVYFVIGAREGREDDLADVAQRTVGVEEKYPNTEVKLVMTPGGEMSGTNARKALKSGNKEKFFTFLPDKIPATEKENIWDLLNDALVKENDPKVGTGKKPKGSGRRLYTDEDPTDTVAIKFSSKQDIIDTLSKTSFKSKPHNRQSQIINVIHQRVRAAYQRAKDPEVKARLKKALEYAEQRKEASKEKTQRLKKLKEGEGGADTSWTGIDNETITLQDILELTKDIKIQNFPTKELASIVLNWDNNPEEIERISQVEVSSQYPVLIMVDEQGKIQWILDGNHRAKKALSAKAETIPAKLIKPSNLNSKARKILLGIVDERLKQLKEVKGSAIPYGSGYKKLIPEITKFMLDKGMNIKPLPVVKFIEDDEENAKNILGRTAFYNPNEKSISLYTLGRHPKDILRSFCHEMIHHMQNVEGRLPKFYTTNTQEDSALNDIEEEAHKLGSMTMREFEDTIKK